MDIVDQAGRRWRVSTPFLPWQSWILTRIRGDEDLSPTPSRRYQPGESGRFDWLAVVLMSLFSPELIVYAVLLSPFLLTEFLVRFVAGTVLWVARRLKLARHKVMVIAYSRGLVHSRTTLRTRDPAAVAEAVRADRATAKLAFHPRVLGDLAEVVAHRSVWQASDDWV